MADTINMGELECMSPGQIALVEERYGARYVGDFSVKQSNGWTDRPVAVFWRTEDHPTYGRYFGMFRDVEAIVDGDEPEVVYGSWMITNAQSVADHCWSGARAADGEIVFSRFRHDFRSSTDRSVKVDGIVPHGVV